jgi:glycosyltransferase XagB
MTPPSNTGTAAPAPHLAGLAHPADSGHPIDPTVTMTVTTDLGPTPVAPVWANREPLPPYQHIGVGEWMVEHGYIERTDLEKALANQRTEGGQLGEQLVAMGAVSGEHLYEALANQWGAPRIDLTDVEPDQFLLKGISARAIIAQGWLPLRMLSAGTVEIATSTVPSPLVDRAVRAVTHAHEISYRTVTPEELWHVVARIYRASLLHDVADLLAETQPDASARESLRFWQRMLPVAVGLVLVAGLVMVPREVFIVLLATANFAFAINVAFRLLATVRWPLRVARTTAWEYAMVTERVRRGLPPRGFEPVSDEKLPIYTVLVPAFREANVIHKVLANLDALDYPKSRLDVLVLLEEDDAETIAAAYAANPPHYVRIVIVPRGDPQTKPRACNYGLTFARGEFVVIYDAEDKPEPDQLRRMVTYFRWDELNVEPRTGKPLVCVQCGLNYFNAGSNVLTRMFAIEYSFWFDAMLPGLDSTGIPIPLGGTSNHFRADMLRRMGGWDPWNVTEDADLGMRASALGYRVGVSTSVTWEEACSQTPAWIKQRTRWIKGYMITAAVNFRNPIHFVKSTGFRGLLSLVGLILGTPLAFMLYPIMLAFTIATYVATRQVSLHLPPWLLDFGMINMLLGAGSMILFSGITASLRHGWRIGVFAIFSPVYWLLHSVAAWRAAWQTLFSPHHWEKTPHGLDDEDDLDALSGPRPPQRVPVPGEHEKVPVGAGR